MSKYPFNLHRRALLLGSLALALCVASSSFAGPTQARPLATGGLPTSVAPPTAIGRSILIGPADPNMVLHIAVSLKMPSTAAAQAFTDSVSDPQNPNYGKFITPQEFGARFGQAPGTVQQVVNYLKSQGFTIKLIASNNLNITADSTVAQAEVAFKTKINQYHATDPHEPGRIDFFSFTTPPQMPPALAPLVLDISGLENYTIAKPRALTPTQTKVLYNLAPLTNAGYSGQGRNVAISNFDGFRLSNLPLYYSTFSLPTPAGGVGNNVSVVALNGGAGSGNPSGEGDIDIQMALGMAPLCHLTIYDGGGFDLMGALTQEANDNTADIISESYGWNLSPATALAAHNVRLQMSAQGITYMNASGDTGTTLGPFTYPNYDPEVLEVGGTVATVANAGTRINEVGWDGSGGGWVVESSPFNIHPAWQVGRGIPNNVNYRMFPDVALHASSDTGAYEFVYNGSINSGFIGTSFASPVFAGSLAVAEQKIIANGGLPAGPGGKHRFGRIANLFYSQAQRPDVWFDVTSGNNGTLPNGQTSNAGSGWDFVTGLGAINFTAFVATIHTAIPPSVVAPNSVGVYNNQGGVTSGGVPQIANVDRSYYTEQSIQTNLGQVAASILQFQLPGNATNAISTTLKVVINAPQGTSNFIYLLNNSTKQYDLITTSPMTGSDTTINVTVNNLASYLNGGSVTMVDRVVSPSRRGFPLFTAKWDAVNFLLGF